jgi:antitoxin (DNA-binding transcriptional repressor) of toxin-antitoxin stability system
MMSEVMGVAELKRRFSEVLNRIELRGERIAVRRRGRTIAVIAPATEDDDTPVAPKARRGLAAAAGAWEEHPDIEGFIAAVRAARDTAVDRELEPLE